MKSRFVKKIVLQGSEKKAPATKKISKTNKKELISITVHLRPKEPLPDLLDQKVFDEFKPVSREVYAEKFGASAKDIKTVHEFAVHAGLSIVKTEAAKRSVELRGTVGEMEDAFKVSLSDYKGSAGITFRGRKGDISIPVELNGIVEGVFGLDNRVIAKPKFKIKKTPKKKKIASRVTSSAYYPTDISKIYNFPPNATGMNQCIALIELGGGYRTADITGYFKTLKITPPKVVAISVDGAHNSPGDANGADGEVMLDIEVAGGIAPGATIAVYFAGNSEKGFLDAINNAIHDTTYKPSVISISWGSAESSAGGWSDSALTAFNQAFQSAATLGVTVCAAAGDNGSNDNVNDAAVHVDFPASSPYVLACGGTLLHTADNKVATEVVWHESDGGATGGGVSDVFPLPAYQESAGVDKSVNTGKTGRGVPDIAGDADPNSGYTIQVDGETMQIGGTSAVAPMMAGLLALINELKNKPAGFIHPLIYKNQQAFRDIISGDNITTTSKKGYTARAGWDACTGLGVPDGKKLLGVL